VAGKRLSEGATRNIGPLKDWEACLPLSDWPEEAKRAFVLNAFADIAERLSSSQRHDKRLTA